MQSAQEEPMLCHLWGIGIRRPTALTWRPAPTVVLAKVTAVRCWLARMRRTCP